MSVARRVATLVAVMISLPFVITAGYWAYKAGTLDTPGYYYSFAAGIVYLLGSPLTLLLFVFIRCVRPLSYSDNWWAIPVMSCLFILQWVLWAQCVVWFVKRRRGILRKGADQ